MAENRELKRRPHGPPAWYDVEAMTDEWLKEAEASVAANQRRPRKNARELARDYIRRRGHDG